MGPGPLERAAQRLVQAMAKEPGPWSCVLPGRRAVRQFLAALAEVLPPSMEAPEALSQGNWLAKWRQGSGRAVDPRTAVHLWSLVLRRAPELRLLQALGQSPPGPDASRAWWLLGRRAADLHRELNQENLDFAALVQRDPGHAGRWKAWLALAEDYARELEARGLVDGDVQRRSAPLREQGRLAWIMVPTASTLEHATLTALGDRVLAMIYADEADAAGFDDFGRLHSDFWGRAHIPLRLDRWQVVETPREGALAMTAEVQRLADAGRQPAWSADEVVLSTPDSQWKPFLERALQSRSLALRDAAGFAVAEHPIVRLLDATAPLLSGWRFQDAARLLRHSDVQAALRESGAQGTGLTAALDDYHIEHLPMYAEELLPRAPQVLADAWAFLRTGLGDLASNARRPLSAWGPSVTAWLRHIYGARDWQAEREVGQRATMVLSQCREVVEGWSLCPAEELRCDGAGALQVLVEELRAMDTLPDPVEPEGTTLELLGWRELLWDRSKALVLGGFQEGSVPEAIGDDALLPPALRRSLGMLEENRRLVRDTYLLQALLASKESCFFVGAQRSVEGDPHRPSRLAFFRPDSEIAAALRHAFPESHAVAPPPPGEEGSARRLPLLPGDLHITSMSVTDFKAYIESPYLYYLQRALRLDTCHDRDRELSPRTFGNLFHDVMEAFGKGPHKDSPDVDRIETALLSALDGIAAVRFGPRALPAVQLQLRGLRRRLRWVAEEQAELRRQGWTIHAVEWGPEGEVTIPSMPEMHLRGRVDRIDRHPDFGFRILDYKTGDGAKDPVKDHYSKTKQEWINLQLPLYTVLCESITKGKRVQLGYFCLGKDPESVGLQLASWTEDELVGAFQKARDVARLVQAGEFGDVGRGRAQESVWQALLGQNLVGEEESGEEAGE
ncbi:MAG: PD-(D/E)XK nuclease family protein [Planctomycetota bacterium]